MNDLEFNFRVIDDSCKHEPSNPECEIVLRKRFKNTWEAQDKLKEIQELIEKGEKETEKLRGLPIPEECRQLNELTIHEYYILVEQQNKALTETIKEMSKRIRDSDYNYQKQVKQLQEELKMLDLGEKETWLHYEEVKSERDQLKSKIENQQTKIRTAIKNMTRFSKEVKKQYNTDSYIPLEPVITELKEILGEESIWVN